MPGMGLKQKFEEIEGSVFVGHNSCAFLLLRDCSSMIRIASLAKPTLLCNPFEATARCESEQWPPQLKSLAKARSRRAISLRWIISARDDLVWFIGSVLSSYALLVLYVTGVVPLVPMVALWAILIDAPHVFGTFSRTYFDRTERQNRARLLWGSLLFFAVGPVMVLAGAGLIFFFIAALWAYYHLVKQHYGFMVLYKKKNNDLAPVDNALDRLLLLFAFNYPFVAFIARDPEAMARVPAALQAA